MRVLIANRGEIALRIQRACYELGLECVAAHTRVDRDALHLRLADETVCIGEQSYLDPVAFIAAAKSRNCDAIHPGYGFLSENAEFAQMVRQNGLIFVGPSAEHIAMMGHKAQARNFMAARKVPVLPGGFVSGLEQAHSLAEDIGYPVMLKASHGGGGMGIAAISQPAALASSYQGVVEQATTQFGSGEVYLEKQLLNARHIELQVFGDGHGAIVTMPARDCSMQRRNQKFIEESPPLDLSATALTQLAQWSKNALSAIAYGGAGTIEFLYEDGMFYFLEMNTRIQVEHTVTEEIAGIDLVKLQLKLSLFGQMELQQEELNGVGHAIECRILAEDEQFMPSPGAVTSLVLPGGPGIRVDTHLYSGYYVSHYYDSLVAKVVSYGATRNEAKVRMQRALAECSIGGIATNLPLLRALLASEHFSQGCYVTGMFDGAKAQSPEWKS